MNSHLRDRLTGIARSPFFHNVGKFVGGSAAAQVIALACSPILTRLYAPEDFGLLGVFMAITGVACTIATLRYDLAIILPKEDSSAWNLLHVAARWSFVAVIVTFLLLYPFRGTLADALGVPALAPYFVWLPLLVLSAGWLSLASNWAVRKKRFGALSQTTVSSSVVGNGLKIGGGLLGFGGGLLIVATFLQQAVHLATLTFRLRKDVPSGRPSLSEGLSLAREHKTFPIYRVPQDAMASIAGNLPNLLLAAYFSPAIVGLYLLAHRVTLAPISLIREAVRKVFYQKATEIHHLGRDLRASVIKMTLGLVALCLPLTLILFFFGEPLFAFAFGPEWAIAGTYAKYIGILVLASVANTPSVVVVPIMGKNQGLLLYEIFSTGIRVGALGIGGLYLNAEATIAAFCLASAFANIFLITWVLHALKNRKNNEPKKTSR